MLTTISVVCVLVELNRLLELDSMHCTRHGLRKWEAVEWCLIMKHGKMVAALGLGLNCVVWINTLPFYIFRPFLLNCGVKFGFWVVCIWFSS